MVKRKKFYLIGIAGVAMASLAGLLKKKGYEVAGSDQDVYEPMAGMLKNLKIPVFTPYRVSNLEKAFHPPSLKLRRASVKRDIVVVVGNVIGRGNPELEYILSNGQAYRSMSDILREEFINSPSDGKKSIVITGTHGKTTTTALMAWILECAGLDPTVFVGGVAKNFDATFKLGKGPYIVLEGDEYDTAFFDKGPKFWHYRPFIGLVNNIELDHVDIFKDIEAYKYAFARFINLIPQNGLLVVNCEDRNVMELVRHAKAEFHVKQFGLKHGDYTAKNIAGFKTNLIGKHNISNILGAVAIARFIGVSHETIKKAVASFEGVKRRAEIIGEKNGIVVIDDYAHHPTAVRETLKAIGLKFHAFAKAASFAEVATEAESARKHGRRVFAIFEPGSASSKRRVFEKEYIKAFQYADIVYLYKPFKASSLKPEEMFHGKQVASALRKAGTPTKSFDRIEGLLFHMKHDARQGDVVVIMSCRGFDNLYKLIWKVL